MAAPSREPGTLFGGINNGGSPMAEPIRPQTTARAKKARIILVRPQQLLGPPTNKASGPIL